MRKIGHDHFRLSHKLGGHDVAARLRMIGGNGNWRRGKHGEKAARAAAKTRRLWPPDESIADVPQVRGMAHCNGGRYRRRERDLEATPEQAAQDVARADLSARIRRE